MGSSSRPRNRRVLPVARVAGGGEGTSAHFGSALTPAGDTNGDGLDDVIVGAPRATLVEFEEGAAAVFFGGTHP